MKHRRSGELPFAGKLLGICTIVAVAVASHACIAQDILPGGTFDLQEDGRSYHGWWRLFDGPSETLRYSLLVEAVHTGGPHDFTLLFRDEHGTCLMEDEGSKQNPQMAVFEGVIPFSCTTIQVCMEDEGKPVYLTVNTETPLRTALRAFRDSEEVPLYVSVASAKRSGSFRVLVTETGEYLWGSTILIHVMMDPSSAAIAQTGELSAGYYSGFVQALGSWDLCDDNVTEAQADGFATSVQTEDLAYVRMQLASEDSSSLTFHIYAPCPYTGP